MGNIPDEFQKRYESYDIRAGEILTELANEGLTVCEVNGIIGKLSRKMALAESMKHHQMPLSEIINEEVLNNHLNFSTKHII
jgi:hypothetical protein